MKDNDGRRAEACLYDSVTVIAELPKELVVVLGTVGQARPLIVPGTQERFLTLGADKVLHAVELPQSRDDPVLYGSPAGATDGDVHLVVTAETVELVDLVGSQARPGPDLPGCAGQLHPTPGAGEVVRVEGLPLQLRVQQLLLVRSSDVALITTLLQVP